MSRRFLNAAAGVLALASASIAVAPASALPAPAPLTTSVSASGAGIEQVRLFRRFYPRRHVFVRRRFGYGRPFYRRGLPGHPIRRILRHL